MADKKKIGDDLMANLRKAFSTKNDVLQYMIKNTPGDALQKAIKSTTVGAKKTGVDPSKLASPKNEFQLLSAELKASVAKKPTKKANPKSKITPKKANPKANTSPAKESKNFNVGVSKGGVSFKEAFAHFRKKGAKTFTWNGKKYTTELKKK